MANNSKENLVMIYEQHRGLYWNPDSKGYTSFQKEAGLYCREEAENISRGLTERHLQLIKPPPDHIVFLKEELAQLRIALGMLTTATPTVEMCAEDPVRLAHLMLVDIAKQKKELRFADACWPEMRRLPKKEFMRNCERFQNCLAHSYTVAEAEELYNNNAILPNWDEFADTGI